LALCRGAFLFINYYFQKEGLLIASEVFYSIVRSVSLMAYKAKNNIYVKVAGEGKNCKPSGKRTVVG